jgi:DNA topoisomerase-3
MASQAGIDLIALIHEELLKSAKLTGIWENKLRRIERGDYSPAEFIAELKEMVNQIVFTVLSDNTPRHINIEKEKEREKAQEKPKAKRKPREKKEKITTLEAIKCPKCGTGHIIKGKTAYGCSNYASGCDMRLSFEQFPATLTPQQLYDSLKKISK